MSQEHPIEPRIEYFGDSDQLPTPEESLQATEMFVNIVEGTLLNHPSEIATMRYSTGGAEYTRSVLMMNTDPMEKLFHAGTGNKHGGVLNLGAGYFNIVMHHAVAEPGITNTVRPKEVSLMLIPVGQGDVEKGRAVYTLSEEGILVRQDIPINEVSEDIADQELARSLAKLNDLPENQVDTEANRRLELQMRPAYTPVGINEVEWLDSITSNANVINTLELLNPSKDS